MTASIQYRTGRDYGKPQVLSISVVLRGADDLDWTTVQFRDDARNIAGVVTVLDFECAPRDIGPAVLREYDAGRYNLIGV